MPKRGKLMDEAEREVMMDEAEREVMMVQCQAGEGDGTMPKRGKLMVRGRSGGR